MAIQYQMDRSEADPFNDPEWQKRQLDKIARKAIQEDFEALKPAKKRKPVDQVAKRDRKVKKLETEIKEIAANPLGKRGRPSSGKVSVHMKLNPETVAAFRAHGPGWQALVSDILDAAAQKG